MGEMWKAVVGFEGRYEVSDQGRIRSLSRVVPCFGGTRVIRERLLRPKVGAYGRLEISLGKGVSRRVHNLVLAAFVGPRPDRMQACHWDGDAGNNRLANLRWDTPSGNAADKSRHGRNPVGERHPNSKLTTDAVAEIRKSLRAGAPTRLIAVAHGVSQGAIVNIARGRTWR